MRENCVYEILIKLSIVIYFPAKAFSKKKFLYCRRLAYLMTACYLASSETQGQSVGSRENFQLRAKEPLGIASHWTISKNSNGCQLLSGHKKTFVLLCPISEPHLLSSFRVFVHNAYCLAILVWFIHQGCACIFARETFTSCFPKQKRRMTVPI